MTRPLTKSEVAQLGKSRVANRRDDVSVPQFLLANAMRGVAFGIGFAALMLLTDTLGILTLVMSQPAPIATALVFVLVCCFKFVPAVLGIALAIATHTK